MANLRLNFAEFCERSDISADDLRRVIDPIRGTAWVAGGAIRRTLIRMPLDSDFDFFFRSADHLAEWEAALPSSLSLLKETEHHKHWRGTIGESSLPVYIQAIRFRYYGSAEEVISSFDYTITQFALDGETLVTTPEALWDLGRRKLAIHKVTYPVATMRRMLKYTNQGFTACAGCMATLLRETASSPEVLAQINLQYVD
jgi:hypothetical protein